VAFTSNIVTIPTAEGLGNKEWLDFWASYIGGILGIAATLIAFSLTAKLNDFQHKQMQEELKEQERINIMPCADVICSKANMLSEYCIVLTSGGKYRFYHLSNESESVQNNCKLMLSQDSIYIVNVIIHNLGGVMRAVTVKNTMMKESAQLAGIITGQSLELCIIHEVDEMSQCEFCIEFEDIQGRRYYQTFSYSLHLAKGGKRVSKYDEHVIKVLKYDFANYPELVRD